MTFIPLIVVLNFSDHLPLAMHFIPPVGYIIIIIIIIIITIIIIIIIIRNAKIIVTLSREHYRDTLQSQ